MNWLTSIMDAMTRASLEGGGVLLVAFVLCRCFRSVPGRVQCWIWRVAFIKLFLALLLITRVELPIGEPIRSNLPLQWNGVMDPVDLTISASPSLPPPTIPQISGVSSGRAWFIALWTVGICGGFVTLARDWRKARVLRDSSFDVAEPEIGQMVRGICHDLKIARVPRIRATDLSSMPSLSGVWRPMLILPKPLLEGARVESLRMIIAHELAHLKRKDLFWVWLPAAAQIMFFFHPIVWLARREHRAAQELACDELAIRVTSSPIGSYAEELLLIVASAQKWTKQNSIFSAGIVESKQALKRRIHSMKFIEHASSRRVLWSAVALTIAAITAVPFRIVAENPVEKKFAAAEERPIKETDRESDRGEDPRSGIRGPVWNRTVSLSARRPGVIRKVHVTLGERVKTGQLLVEIDDEEAHLRLKGASARRQLAEASFKVKLSELAVHENVAQTPQERSLIAARKAEAEAEMRLADVSLEEAELELRMREIRAPREGIVVKLNSYEGETINGSPEVPIVVLSVAVPVASDYLQMKKEKLSDLLLKYRESHPAVQELRREIAELEEPGRAGASIEDLKQQLRVSRERYDALPEKGRSREEDRRKELLENRIRYQEEALRQASDNYLLKN